MHKFLEMHKDAKVSDRLKKFYDSSEFEKYQHTKLLETEYLPNDPMYVDFNEIDNLENPDFTDETIGDVYLEFANLLADPETDPEGYECYAHLAIHPESTKIYLMEPSGDPELIAESLDDLLKKLSAA